MNYVVLCVNLKIPLSAKNPFQRIFASKIQITKRTIVEKIVINLLKKTALPESIVILWLKHKN